MVPVTDIGRVFCVLYALFGIPLTLITIGDIGKFVSVAIKRLYRRSLLTVSYLCKAFEQWRFKNILSMFFSLSRAIRAIGTNGRGIQTETRRLVLLNCIIMWQSHLCVYCIVCSAGVEWNVLLTNINRHTDLNAQRASLVVVTLQLNAKHRPVGNVASQR